MTLDLLGCVVAATENPHFGIPVFRKANGRELYVQKISKEGLVDGFNCILPQEIGSLSMPSETAREAAVEAGSLAHYAFFISKSESFFGDRPSVEEFICDNIAIIENFPIAHLQALRFIGCSRSSEIEAIDRFSRIFENDIIRERFVAVERAMLQATEVDEEIEGLIDRLGSSPNFASTHKIVAALQVLKGEFKPRHFKMSMRACLSNSQVHWISGDEDVKNFISFLIEAGNLRLTKHAKSILET